MDLSIDEKDLDAAIEGLSNDYPKLVYLTPFLQLRVITSYIHALQPADFIELFHFVTFAFRPNRHSCLVSGVLRFIDLGNQPNILGHIFIQSLIFGVFHVDHLAFFWGVFFIYGLVFGLNLIINFIEGQFDFVFKFLHHSLILLGVWLSFGVVLDC